VAGDNMQYDKRRRNIIYTLYLVIKYEV